MLRLLIIVFILGLYTVATLPLYQIPLSKFRISEAVGVHLAEDYLRLDGKKDVVSQGPSIEC